MSQPHLFLVLADDYGWANAGWHRPANYSEVQTPNLDALVRSGIELERHYAFKYCSPSRSALQSGRNPTHVNVNNYLPIMHNAADPVSGFSAIPRNMTGIASLLQRAGYTTLMAGKWDAGMATPDHTPKGRGYDHSLVYFNHQNDYWTRRGGASCPSNTTGHTWHAYSKPKEWPQTHEWQVRDGYLAAGDDLVPPRNATLPEAEALCAPNASCAGFTFTAYDPAPLPSEALKVSFKTAVHFVADTGVVPLDLWMDDAPAPASMRNPQPACSGVPYPANDSAPCVYEDDLFADFLEQRVSEWRAGAPPLFVFWAFHSVHSPYQVPRADEDAFAFIDQPQRRTYAAMVAHMDGRVGRLTSLLQRKGMLENSFVVFCADNGGPITQAANNWPLRGGKHSIAQHRIASHRIASHRIASHRIASHRIASHRIASRSVV
jgi:arylsulfatase A-like enzyme